MRSRTPAQSQPSSSRTNSEKSAPPHSKCRKAFDALFLIAAGIITAACVAVSGNDKPLIIQEQNRFAVGGTVITNPGPDGQTFYGEIVKEQTRANGVGHLNKDDSIRDILSHPAFAGFAHLILPWDDRAYDENMLLTDIGSLLPYHSHVNPDVVVSALNHMIDDVNDGKAVFYDFYTRVQKQEQPAREHTGLFFFRGKLGAPFAVISPGGGFSYVGSVHEGFPYAAEISNKGYNAFVLRYRAGYGGAVATQDLAAAISYIFRNAEMLGIGTENYSLWGSSSGARMAAAIGSHGVASYGGDDLPKPSAVVMAYTAHTESSSDEPPTFVVVGEQDGIAPPSTMERRVAALRRAGTEVEYHKYTDIDHGFGLGTGTSAEGWIADAIRFWGKFIKNSSGQ